MTEATRQALSILRSPSQLQWYVVPLLLVVLYAYAVEVERRSWSVVLGGLALWGMDWFNEIWNALVLHFTGYSAVWTAPGRTAFLIFVGLNIEITFMFALMGLAVLKLSPADPRVRILGLPNRWVLSVLFSLLAVFVEVLLHLGGLLVWAYDWWDWPSIGPIFLVGYLPFMIAAYAVHDMRTMRSKLLTVGTIYGIDVAGILVFGVGLGWI